MFEILWKVANNKHIKINKWQDLAIDIWNGSAIMKIEILNKFSI
jgi:hypothetical protein